MLLQLKPLFVLHPVDLKRMKCFNPSNKETVTGGFEMRGNSSYFGVVEEGRRIRRSVHHEAICFLLF
jgi:hypothetical protein